VDAIPSRRLAVAPGPHQILDVLFGRVRLGITAYLQLLPRLASGQGGAERPTAGCGGMDRVGKRQPDLCQIRCVRSAQSAKGGGLFNC